MTDNNHFPSWEEFRQARRSSAQPVHDLPITKSDEVPHHSATTEQSTYAEEMHQERTKRICLIILIIAIAGAFAGLFLKFSFDRAYVEQELAAISQSNKQAFEDLSTRLGSIEEEMNAISQTLEEAGASIDNSGVETREAMEAQITALNKELSELKKSLEILKESKGNI